MSVSKDPFLAAKPPRSKMEDAIILRGFPRHGPRPAPQPKGNCVPRCHSFPRKCALAFEALFPPMKTGHLLIQRSPRLPALLLAVGLASSSASAAGIPEPSLVVHGVVTDALGKRSTTGTIQLTLTPVAGGTPIRASIPVTELASGFSFAQLIRTETPVPGQARSANTLALPVAAENWRVTATLGGTTNANLLPAGRTNLAVSLATRGQLLRTDLSLGVDTDGNGLIDAWEMLYFGKLGNSPTASAAGDGISNLAKMYAGLDPRGSTTTFPNFTLAQAREDGAFLIEWSSQSGRTYTVLRSTSLDGPFQSIQAAIPATPPANRLVDTGAAALPNAFYRVQANP